MSSANAVANSSTQAPPRLAAVPFPLPELVPVPQPGTAATGFQTNVPEVSRRAGIRVAHKPAAARRAGFMIGDACGALLVCLIVPAPGALRWAIPALWVFLVAVMRGYESRLVLPGAEDLRRVVRAGLFLVGAVALTSWALVLRTDPHLVLTVVALTIGFSLAQRVAWAGVLSWNREQGRGLTHKVVLAGHHRQVAEVIAELGRSRSHGFEVVAACTHGKRRIEPLPVPHTSGLRRLADTAVEAGADGVIVLPCKHFTSAALRRLGWQLGASNTQLFVAPGLADVVEARATVTAAGSLSMMHVRAAELKGWRRVLKEGWERLAAMIALLLLSPLLLGLMIVVRLDSRGPAIFRQTRVGRDDQLFTMYKLRTMSELAEEERHALAAENEGAGLLFKVRKDPRVTRVGSILRRYSLDELPQLVNVALGHMALVGPRPPLPSEVARYGEDVRRRLAVKPGLTGLWQVSGRSNLPWEEAVRLDLRYVDNWSLGLDLVIIMRTVRAVVSHQGAY